MNTHDPIVGRYVYVQCEGKTYRTYYEEHGEGIPLVCLHTAGTDGRQYRHQLCDPDIAANFRVIAFDMPWHGKSMPPSDFYLKEDEYKLTTRKFYSEFIVAFCRALELKKPVHHGPIDGRQCLPVARATLRARVSRLSSRSRRATTRPAGGSIRCTIRTSMAAKWWRPRSSV